MCERFAAIASVVYFVWGEVEFFVNVKSTIDGYASSMVVGGAI